MILRERWKEMEEMRRRKFAKAHINKFITIMDIGFGNCYHIKGRNVCLLSLRFRCWKEGGICNLFFFTRMANKVLFSGFNVFIAYVAKTLFEMALCCMEISQLVVKIEAEILLVVNMHSLFEWNSKIVEALATQMILLQNE